MRAQASCTMPRLLLTCPPSCDDAAAAVTPGEEAFDLPPALRATERPAVLGDRTPPAIRRDHLDAVLLYQSVVEAIAVVAAVTDQPPREVRKKRASRVAGTRCGS
jgi:hypothetical protein